ncbi:unnamed protein product, partial [Ilex paraguariensis]
MESLGKQFLETLFREGWRFTLLNSRQALAPDTVPGLGGGSVSRPGVPEEGLAAPVLVGGFIGLAVEGAARVARVHLGRLGTHLAEPVKEVGQVGDDVRSILRRARRPAKATGVQTGRTVEGAGVQPLGEVLEQTVGVALARVGLQVFEEHPHRAGHFRHPGQAAVVAAVQAIVQQGLQHPRRAPVASVWTRALTVTNMVDLDSQGAQQVSCAFEIDVARMHDHIHGAPTAALEPGIEELGAAQQQFEIPPFNIDVIA